MAQLTFIRIVACSSQWMLFAGTGPCVWPNWMAAFCFLCLLSPSPAYLSSSLRAYRPTRHVLSKFASRSVAFAWVIWYRTGQLLVLCGVVWCFAVLWVLCGVLRCCGRCLCVVLCGALRCCVMSAVFCCFVWCFVVSCGVLRCCVVYVVCCTCLFFDELPSTPRKYL